MESAVQRFLANYREHERLFVVFYATWFRPSMTTKKQWESKKAAGLPVVFIDVDEQQELVEELKLPCVPAIYTFQQGEITNRKLL